MSSDFTWVFAPENRFRAAFSLCGAACVCAVVYVSIKWKQLSRTKSELHTVKSALYHWSINTFMGFLSSWARRKLETQCEESDKVQDDLLLEILSATKDTAYGKDHGFAAIVSKADFRAKHPLSRYDQFEKYVERVAAGEKNVMTASDVISLGVTSGTSGSKKRLPVIKKQRTNFFLFGVCPIYKTMYDHFPETRSLQKTLKVMAEPTFTFSEGGIKTGANSSAPSDSKALLHMYTTPACAYLRVRHKASLSYLHALYALLDENLGCLESNFISNIFRVLDLIAGRWHELVQDIALGSLPSSLQIEPAVRQELLSGRRPNPLRAAAIARAFKEGTDGFVERVWPRLNLVLSTATGEFAMYAKKARRYLGERIPIWTPVYAATEGLLGVSLWPERGHEFHECFVLVPRAAFFEFIPVKCMDEAQPAVVDWGDVVVGEEYEVVMTTWGGLYRYRFGDVVKVRGRHHSAPVVEFRYRTGQLVNLCGEKTTSAAFYGALINSLARRPDTVLVDYTCVSSDSLADDATPGKGPAYYITFVELEGAPVSAQACAAQLDEELCDANPIYKTFRLQDSIAPLQMRIVRPGTFEEVRALLVAEGNPPNQLKIPRVARHRGIIDLLNKSTVESL